jgi:hypothetical protein
MTRIPPIGAHLGVLGSSRRHHGRVDLGPSGLVDQAYHRVIDCVRLLKGLTADVGDELTVDEVLDVLHFTSSSSLRVDNPGSTSGSGRWSAEDRPESSRVGGSRSGVISTSR